MSMDIVQDVLEHFRDFQQRALDIFADAPLPAKIAGFAAGIWLSMYGAYCLWFYGGTRRVRSKVSLKGKTVIITGANAGIGRETAVDLASRGARVIMACRNPTKAQAAVVEVRQRSGNDDVVFRQLDTSDLQSVRDFAEQILKEEDRLDILINNAGIGNAKFCITPEGFDILMATNHVGHFALTLPLIGLLKKSAPSRIVNVSSLAHVATKEVDYTNKSAKGLAKGIPLYARSKLANVHFAKELSRRLAGTGVTAYSLHPGAIYSSIWETSFNSVGARLKYMFLSPIFKMMLLSEKDGAQTTIYCAIDENVTNQSGGYFSNCGLAKESDLGKDEGSARQLWDVSCEATGIDPNLLPA